MEFNIGEIIVDEEIDMGDLELDAVKMYSDDGTPQNEVYVGTDEPTEESVEVWIDPSGEPDKIPTKTSELENDSNFITIEDTIENITQLTTNLEANKVYKGEIYLGANTTFVLPTITDNTKLHTIEMIVEIHDYDFITIDLGVTRKMNDFELSDGTFIIYYEYLGDSWAVGVLPITESE